MLTPPDAALFAVCQRVDQRFPYRFFRVQRGVMALGIPLNKPEYAESIADNK